MDVRYGFPKRGLIKLTDYSLIRKCHVMQMTAIEKLTFLKEERNLHSHHINRAYIGYKLTHEYSANSF